MKNLYLILPVMLLCTVAQAQVAVPMQPDTGYYRRTVNTIAPHSLTEAQLKSLSPQALPAGIADTLKKYDWYDVCGYSYGEKIFTNYFSTEARLLGEGSKQLNFKRYCADGVVGDFSLSKTLNGTVAVYTTTFDRNTATQFKGVKTVKNAHYLTLEVYGETEYLQIIQCNSRLLVVDITRYGRIGEKPVKYRLAYYGIAQQFNW